MSQSQKVKNIVFDCDGVLADLSRGLALLDGYEDPIVWYRKRDPNQDTYFNAIQRHIDDGVFEKLPVMSSYTKMITLMNFLKVKGYKCYILTSIMDTPFSDKIRKQKYNWINKHFGKYIDSIIFVNSPKEKLNHIKDDSILIDDYETTQNHFIENGKEDNFILFENFDVVKQELFKKLGVSL